MTGKNKSFIGYSHLEAIVFYDDYGNIHIQRTSSKSITERETKRERENVDTIYIINYRSRTTTSKFS